MRKAVHAALIGFAFLLSACNQQPKYALTVEVAPGGKVEVTPGGICPGGMTCSFSYPAGTRVTLVPLPDSDHYFGGWDGACQGFGSCTLEIRGNLRAVAQYNVILGEFDLGALPDLIVVPAGSRVFLEVPLLVSEGFNAPLEALEVRLTSPLVGSAPDQVSYTYRPDLSTLDRLVLVLEGPDPNEVWTYLAFPARLEVKLSSKVRQREFTLAAAPCLAGCGR
ncbi:hypothetical protein [Thermus filiformis]|uniref:hypothetical protein n=1 Tax=Thermus filiformis TaxID=276 RepID=UPI000530F1B0|nr:hypothetical protein [Thermus filiformis]